jgi:hypothetical protein
LIGLLFFGLLSAAAAPADTDQNNQEDKTTNGTANCSTNYCGIGAVV